MPDLPPPPFPVPSPERPLAGVTLLLVEDSRFASEVVRLLCLRSGARIRRADTLRAAERHLATYRPTAALVDLGLPDGSGLDLIGRLAAARPRLSAILATSGDPELRDAALAAGADGFLPKPVASVAAFQDAVLGALGAGGAAAPGSGAGVAPDMLAYREDLRAAAGLLAPDPGRETAAYAARFVAGVARAAGDGDLAAAAATLAQTLERGAPGGPLQARLADLVARRLTAAPADLCDGRRIA